MCGDRLILLLAALSFTGCNKVRSAGEWLRHLRGGTSSETYAERASDDGSYVAPPLDAPAELGQDDSKSVAPGEDDCIRKGMAHHWLELEKLRLSGVITGRKGGAIAMVTVGKSAAQSLRVGDYIGTHCWRVQKIEPEHIVLEEAYSDDVGHSHSHTARVGLGDGEPQKVTVTSIEEK